MSNVTLVIGGRNYTVACAEGEERHIEALGRTIDGKLNGPNLSGQSEARTLLFAALLLADEVHEMNSGTPSLAQSSDPQAGETLEIMAQRLESLAVHLESTVAGA